MRDDAAVAALVERARDGDQDAWDEIVERYAALLWAVCARHGLTGPDAEDVGATVWLRLVERLGEIREPAALPGWLATTARRECVAALRAKNQLVPVDREQLSDKADDAADDEWLVRQERLLALRTGFGALSENCQRLLLMLFGDEPRSYDEIQAALGMRKGGIGPTRSRCLDKLRHEIGEG
jgi:RNA polymerase sigma factor (sigma-70 family)